jgi:predicted anti-sigma-YlaC factor YlaD
MDCTRAREAVSAQLDGEHTGVDPQAVRVHLHRCGACRAYRARALDMRDTLRVIDDAAREREPLLERPARIALFLLALAQLSLAIPNFVFGTDEGAPIHIAHEVGSWDVALAIAFIFVAWRPLRAVGMLPFVTALAFMLVATAVFDLADGHAVALFETQHLLEVAGSILLWYLARPVALPWRRKFHAMRNNREPLTTAERPM